jgi:hypothetical protein
MDDDLAAMSREQLADEVRRLRHGIRAHRDTPAATRRPDYGLDAPPAG